MKKILILALCFALGTLAASTVMAYTGLFTPGSGINGTPHDLGTSHNGMGYTALPADTVGGRICIFCHAPHNAMKLSPANGGPGAGIGGGVDAPDAFDYLPLWNHEVTQNYASYTMYQNGPGAPQTGPHASQAIFLGMTPGSVSLLCLSCHDGSVAVNSYGSTVWQPSGSTSSGGGMIAPQYVIGKDNYLGNHHPVGFDYDAVQGQDTEIRESATVLSDYGSNTMTIADHLYGGKLECGSCHSVHNKNNTGERLLWRSDVNSQLCLTCHDKGVYTPPETAAAGPLP